MRVGSRRILGRATAGAVALLALALTASPALATTTGQLAGRADGYSDSADGSTFSFQFTALGVADGQTVDPNSVKVSIAGAPADATATSLSSGGDVPKRTTILTIDASGSMKDKGYVEPAKQAARAYLDAVPADVYVGLVTFNATPTVVVEPTLTHADVAAALDGIVFEGGTALYDGIIRANRTLGADGIRSQLLLSDGGDTDSSNSQAQAENSLKASGVTLDAVALGTDVNRAELDALTKAGNGEVVEVSDAQKLTDVFNSAAQSQNAAVAVTVTVPEALRGTAQTVLVSGTVDGTPISANPVFFMPDAPATPTAAPSEAFGPVPVEATSLGVLGSGWLLWAALLGLLVGFFVLLAVALLATDPETSESGRVRRRLSRYSLNSRPDQSSVETSGALGTTAVARSAVEFAGRAVQGRDLDNMLGTKLEAAGVPLKPAEWLLVHLGIFLGAGLVFALLSKFGVLATLIGLVLGAVLPWAYLSVKEERRMSRFQAQLPDTLQLIAGSLAAGYSLPQAVDAIVREAEGPMQVELNRAIVEARLGVPMEDALETVAKRMNSVDFAWVVMAIRIQREVGGNLSEVLTNVAATMRERERLRRQVEVLSAEGRLSAIILGLLPLGFILFLSLRRPDYLSVLITTPLGLVMVVVGVVLLIAGIFWLRKTVKVEV